MAVLVRLSDHNEVSPGAWYLEAGFGSGLEGPAHPTFRTLDEAKDWIAGRLASRAKPVAGAQSRGLTCSWIEQRHGDPRLDSQDG